MHVRGAWFAQGWRAGRREGRCVHGYGMVWYGMVWYGMGAGGLPGTLLFSSVSLSVNLSSLASCLENESYTKGGLIVLILNSRRDFTPST